MSRYLLASQPSTGSTWVSNAIQKAKRLRGPFPEVKEQLNPVLNHRDYAVLRPVFGSELAASVPVLAGRFPKDKVVEVATSCYDSAKLGMTKEVFLHFRLEDLVDDFDITILTREFSETFPPNRGRVMVWYHNMLQSLILHNRLCPEIHEWAKGKGYDLTMEVEVMISFLCYKWKLEQVAKDMDLPIWKWGDLQAMGESELPKVVGTGVLAKQLIDTRRLRDRPREHLWQWTHALSLEAEFTDLFEEKQKQFYRDNK